MQAEAKQIDVKKKEWKSHLVFLATCGGSLAPLIIGISALDSCAAMPSLAWFLIWHGS